MAASIQRVLALLAAAGVTAWLSLAFLASRFQVVEHARVAAVAAPEPQPAPASLAHYCGSCHRAGRSGMDFASSRDVIVRHRDRAIWRKAVQYLRNGDMPPAGKPQPPDRERELLIDWIEKGLIAAESQADAPLAIRRLTRLEYSNAVRDLLGVDFQPGESFPVDDSEWSASETMPHLSAADQDRYTEAAQQVIAALPATDTPELTWDEVRASAAGLAGSAFCRPCDDTDVQALLKDVDARQARGEPVADGMKAALLAILTSPRFLFVVEKRQHSIDSISSISSGQEAQRDDFKLASRLALFLWKSVPDATLLNAARLQTLPEQLTEQVVRMLQDRRAEALVEGFTNDWLELETLGRTAIRDADLLASMRRETQSFFAHVMRADRPVLDFLEADYSFRNERLARHYGIAGIEGESFRQVALAGTQRGGLLFHASVLTLTSPPSDTSPVKRGKWVLDNLLGDPPGPPPAEAARLAKSTPSFPAGTLRQLLKRHRADAACVGCHATMDAIGLALENFDSLGAWRSRDGAFTVEAVGDLPDGGTLRGPDDLRAYLRTRRLDFLRCLTGKLLTYALGRKLEERDQEIVREIASRAATDDFRFSSLIVAIVSSAAFQVP
ncbi:MAG: DUF1592 domain-containing protein [Planctomycetes bacterium]|nr:DUF1592 domain-containing protein [Planctomycetota bacterium]